MNYNRYSYVMNNPTRSVDPTGYYMAELKEERFESPGFDEVNAGDSGLRGGGGGFGSDPFGYHANTYYYNNGIYFNWNGDDVSFEEVFNNYILPNSRQTFIRNPFYNGSDRDYVINSLKSESGQIFFAGLTFKDGQQWYSRDGYKKLEQILNNYNSGSNNPTGQGGYSGDGPLFTVADWTNNGIGGLATGMERSRGTFRLSNSSGFSLRHYASGWRGNGSVTTYNTATWGSRIAKGSLVVNLGLGAYSINNANIADGRTFGYNTQVATGQFVGGMAGSMAGAEIGAAIGVWFGGVGAIPGAVIGGVVGGWGGSELGGVAVDWYY